MELLDNQPSIIRRQGNSRETFLKFHAYLLKKMGKKIVDLDDYKDEELEVGMNYPEISPQCIEEKNKGAEFGWLNEYHPSYERNRR